MTATAVLGFSDYAGPAERLARELGAPYAEIAVHRFPDGESRVTVPQVAAGHLVICRSLDRPNDKLVELLLAARTLRAAGATALNLAAPYLCYMRQDIAFHPGEAVSQRIIGGLLGELFDSVITVDPHLHRIACLAEAIPAANAVALSAAPLIGEWLCENAPDALLLGPDAESLQWVGAIAQSHRFEFGVCTKVRSGDRVVTVELPAIDCAGRHVVLVDDMASTGRTLAATAGLCAARGARRVDVAVVHGLLFGDAEEHLREHGVSNIWSTDSIPQSTSVIPLARLLAAAVRELPPDPSAVRFRGAAEQERR